MTQTSDPPGSLTATELGTTLAGEGTLPSGADGRDDAPLNRGTEVGRYVVLQVLGSGAMGMVYAAYDPELDRKVALKLLRPHDDGGDLQARLLREAQAMARLSHPNVVAVHDVGTFREQVFVAMEFVDGGTLSDRLDQALPWREALRLFVPAARGLAAAHAADLVHRDFKPENVLVRADGRVLVTDFGLARASGEKDVPTGDDLPHASASASALELELTRTGKIMGTPAYMAPEQHLGRPTDARTDQFAFCVALYEAVYGERPFAADNLAQLVVNVTGGNVREPSRDPGIPAWLRRSLLRGLSVDPEARWPSMDGLVQELVRRPAAIRRRQTVIVAALGVAGLGGALWAGAPEPAALCTGGTERIASVWSAEDRQAVEAALEGSGVPYARATWSTVATTIDRFTGEWSTMHREACMAHSRGEQSDQLLDTRMACLEGQLSDLRARVEVLRHADAAVAERAVQTVTDLPAVQTCANTERLLLRTPPPQDPERAKELRRLEQELARARALESAGSLQEARDVVVELEPAARALAHKPFLAELLSRRGSLEGDLGDDDTALDTLEEAFWAGLASRADDAAVDAAAFRAFTLSERQARFGEALSWAEHARSLVARGGVTQEHGALIENAVANVHFRKGDHDQALVHYERLLALTEKSHTGDHPAKALAMNNLGNVLEAMGEYEAAAKLQRQGLEMKRKLLGAEHPDVGLSLVNLANLDFRQGRLKEAKASYEEALQILEGALGPEHARVAEALTNLGSVAEQQRDWKRAAESQRRALAIFEKTLGPDHPNTGAAHTNLGAAQIRLKQYAKALESHRRALQIFEKSIGTEHPFLGYPLTGMGEAYLGLGRTDAALDFLDRALALREAHEPDKTAVADTRFAMARALAADGRLHDARPLAEQAIDALDGAGEGFAKDRAEIQAWLAANPG